MVCDSPVAVSRDSMNCDCTISDPSVPSFSQDHSFNSLSAQDNLGVLPVQTPTTSSYQENTSSSRNNNFFQPSNSSSSAACTVESNYHLKYNVGTPVPHGKHVPSVVICQRLGSRGIPPSIFLLHQREDNSHWLSHKIVLQRMGKKFQDFLESDPQFQGFLHNSQERAIPSVKELVHNFIRVISKFFQGYNHLDSRKSVSHYLRKISCWELELHRGFWTIERCFEPPKEDHTKEDWIKFEKKFYCHKSQLLRYQIGVLGEFRHLLEIQSRTLKN
ncbi:hypothetical protein CANTEDRAFT_94956 [Yamadazyma tenuis ATCC 10573]|uniref:Uncharacterized protein n=1 Tax=Candida tenuis (strain ATCC 10573 / BCRC 21748 / CBS 615 / JCM 9827 / NBRC 10315 / NRRL Y-1498 / VKM Y-70) TaxID=590646 RepID=G3BAP0_CANTC|nr:uncharacterized protein CANTEDRAFT_94956 [Yamadazyma tenuis ATCC 10573]EGV62068.1 hypothetical protein CANTEDRAFT_94956 [Yamadazyma tenuis ATCC 10573]